MAQFTGRARISRRRPRAMGESDRSGFWYNHGDLVQQFMWSGNRLVPTGWLVGPDEVDVPNPQLRSIILPGDPRPILNARPSPNVTGVPIIGQPLPTTPGNLGFSQYELGPSNPPLYPQTFASALAAALAIADVTAPADLGAYAVPLVQNTTATILSANPTRTFLMIFNPTWSAVQISTGTATLGALGNLAIGPGEAYFWATSQSLGTVYQGAMTAISGWGGRLPLWIWEDSTLGLTNDGGVLVLTGGTATGWPVTSAGAAGSAWSNGGVCSVIPGAVPDPLAPPILFGGISPGGLLTLGGGNLPIVQPAVGSLILWNNGGEIWVG